MAVAAKTLPPRSSDPVFVQCTQLLASYACNGERRIFDELAEIAVPFLSRRASVEVAKRHACLDVAEVVQEALLNIFRYAKSFRPTVPHAFATWASRIVANVVLRFLRQRKGPRPISIDELEGWELPARPGQDPVRSLHDAEERRELCGSFSIWLQAYYHSFLGLTELQKRILHRVEIHGECYREIAESLGMRVEAVKMVVYRGRKRLQEDMQRMAAG